MTIDVIEALDASGEEIVRRVPSSGAGEFKLGAQVIVRESQVGVFFRDGKVYDAFGPGRHTLSTLNLPLVGQRVTDRVFGESPFRAEVYFVNQKVFMNVKWGTRDPIAYRDKELALVRLRAHGQMALRVSDPVLFVNKVVGTQGVFTTKDVLGLLKAMVLSSLAQTIGGVLESIFDLPTRYSELATAAKVRVFEEFAAYGAELVDFVIESITPPDEVQARIDERSGMAAIGDLDSYLRYKSAIAIEDAASNPSGAGGDVGAAAGLGLGLAVMRQAQSATEVLGAAIGPARAPASIHCSSCGQSIPQGVKFCPECGTSLIANLCANCKQPLTGSEKFCANCGTATGRS
jgi:membrane protease subunit (stomatin/prohibitin family)